jgi:NifU homolog involved in Fe-S cluster formation
MSDLPYSTAVLRWAAEAHGAGKLAQPCLCHTETNPVCGDKIAVSLRVSDSRISDFAQDSRACVLTQASASILAAALPGHSEAELAALRDAVSVMLTGGPIPEGVFAPYGVLADVARHPARHRCVLLPIDAALKALATEPASQRA